VIGGGGELERFGFLSQCLTAGDQQAGKAKRQRGSFEYMTHETPP
jgi:hypothetical protein